MSNHIRNESTSATKDVASPRPVWRQPLVHAGACLGVGAAVVLADMLLF